MAIFAEGELAVRRISLPKRELVFFRHVLEASEGLGFLVAESGGEAFVMTPKSQEAALDTLLSDLAPEVSMVVRGEYCRSELAFLAR